MDGGSAGERPGKGVILLYYATSRPRSSPMGIETSSSHVRIPIAKRTLAAPRSLCEPIPKTPSCIPPSLIASTQTSRQLPSGAKTTPMMTVQGAGVFLPLSQIPV